jgi:hypothetical protein
MAPHILTGWTFSRQDLSFDKEQNIYICPTGKILTTAGSWSMMGMRFSTRHATAAAASSKAQWCPKNPLRRFPRKCKARLGDWRGSDDELCEPAAAKPPIPRAHRRAFATSENGPPNSSGSWWNVGSLPLR